MMIPFSLKESNGDFSKNYESNSGTISFDLKMIIIMRTSFLA